MNSLTEGKYKIDLSISHENTEESALIASYIAPKAIITKETDLLTMTLMLLNHETILGIQMEVQGEWIESANLKVDHEENRRYELYELSNLSEIMTARVQYEIGFDGRIIKGDEEIRIELDQMSLKSF